MRYKHGGSDIENSLRDLGNFVSGGFCFLHPLTQSNFLDSMAIKSRSTCISADLVQRLQLVASLVESFSLKVVLVHLLL